MAVINFAQTSVGAMGASVMADLWGNGMSLWLALPIGVVLAAVLNLAIGAVLITWFADGTTVVKTAVTISLFTALIALGGRFFNAQDPRTFPAPFESAAVHVAGVAVTWLVVVTVLAAIALTFASSWVLQRTRLGLRMRALSDRPKTAELIGVPSGPIAMLVWAGSGALTALALILVAPLFPADFETLAMLATGAFAAALVGSFRSFPLTLAGGLVIGALQGSLNSIGELQPYRGAVPLLFILAAVLWTNRSARWESPAQA